MILFGVTDHQEMGELVEIPVSCMKTGSALEFVNPGECQDMELKADALPPIVSSIGSVWVNPLMGW